jgi:hypothetical protein
VELYLHSPYTSSWHGAQLKHRDNFTFTFISTFINVFYKLPEGKSPEESNMENEEVREWVLFLSKNQEILSPERNENDQRTR